ncbi:hypothetical protein NMG60_11036573 [Bertholletia excelsa]
MPQELPGFYFDPEKNRYFPVKGRIPGSSRGSSSVSTSGSSTTSDKPVSKHNQQVKVPCRRIRIKTAKLLQVRELCGNVITSHKRKCNFQEEYQKIQASQPMVWKYHKTGRIGDGALEHIYVNIDMADGLTGTDVLLAGSANGYLSLHHVGKAGQQFAYGVNCMSDCVWPINNEIQLGSGKARCHLQSPAGASIHMSSNISSIKNSVKHSSTEGSVMRNVLVTTLGSETSGGSVYVLNLNEPLDFNLSSHILSRRMREVACLNCTVWTADCNSDGSQAVVGTNLGAALVNLETGVPSWVFRSKSDVLSLQFDSSGQIVLCGLRNGAIVTVDARQKPEVFSGRLTRHLISYPSHGTSKPSSRTTQNFTKRWFELKGNLFHPHIISMPSSISCLASLQLYEQHFLASSMDGLIRLYDHRLVQRGPIQSYEGNVNSHTRIQLGVDPCERIVMSGGEDCKLRLWSIKSGELLFEDKFMNSIPSTVCWSKKLPGVQVYGQEPCLGAWLGSQEGLFYMHCS